MLESSGAFNENSMASSISGIIEIPMGATEGKWNIRIILQDALGSVTNLGPSDLEIQNFQNYIYVNNTVLGLDHGNTPTRFFLHENYPNPFNPITTIRYDLPSDEFVSITIYDMLGNIIKNLVNEKQQSDSNQCNGMPQITKVNKYQRVYTYAVLMQEISEKHRRCYCSNN